MSGSQKTKHLRLSIRDGCRRSGGQLIVVEWSVRLLQTTWGKSWVNTNAFNKKPDFFVSRLVDPRPMQALMGGVLGIALLEDKIRTMFMFRYYFSFCGLSFVHISSFVFYCSIWQTCRCASVQTHVKKNKSLDWQTQYVYKMCPRFLILFKELL